MRNLLLEILEELEFDRLLEEGKDPVEILHYKYQNVPDSIIDKVISIDPTKKKSYSQWLLSKWDDESDVIKNNLRNGRIEKLFQHYKTHSDIQIKDCPSVSEGLRDFVPEEDTVLTKSDKPTTYLLNLGEEVDSELANDFDIVFNEDDWIIAVPNTYEAECKLGENMKWCTANAFGDGRGYYNRYLSEYGGKYFVNFDMSNGESRNGKDYPFTRYQFHFESNQFMNKEDDPVDGDDIGMPDSAIEFYEENGYDTRDFYNVEARYERYLEERADSYYAINDDLYLNIEWDNEYHYEEPNELTEFYLFSVNDDIDPISWETLKNPHYNNDFIIINNDSFVLLECKYGGYIIAYIDGYNWRSINVAKYFVLPNDIGFFVYDDGHYGFILDNKNGYYEIDSFRTREFDNAFINEYCTNADKGKENRSFLEVVSDDIHSLFAISDSGVETIIRKDIPENDIQFIINKNGIINGKYRKYKAYENAQYDDESDDVSYDVHMELNNGDYLIFKLDDNRGEFKYNILSVKTKKILCNEWFDNFLGYADNIYCVANEGSRAYINQINGDIIGNKWYDAVEFVDKENHMVYGIMNRSTQYEVDFIDSLKCEVIFKARKIVCGPYGDSHKVGVLIEDDTNVEFFDYVERKMCFTQFTNVTLIAPPLFLCEVQGGADKVIFDFSEEKILMENIRNIAPFGYGIKMIEKTNNKFNLLNVKRRDILLPYDIDNFQGYHTERGVISYKMNNRYFLYDYINKKFLINQNGFPFKIEIRNYYEIKMYNNTYCMVVEIFNDGSFNFIYWKEGDSGDSHFDINDAPKEVMDMYNCLRGVNESIKREFYKYLNMINETRKLYR